MFSNFSVCKDTFFVVFALIWNFKIKFYLNFNQSDDSFFESSKCYQVVTMLCVPTANTEVCVAEVSMNLRETRAKYPKFFFVGFGAKQEESRKRRKTEKKCWVRSVEVISTRNQFIVVEVWCVSCCCLLLPKMVLISPNRKGKCGRKLAASFNYGWNGIFSGSIYVSYRNEILSSVINCSMYCLVVQCFLLLWFCCSLAWRKTRKCWMNITFRLQRRLNEDFYGLKMWRLFSWKFVVFLVVEVLIDFTVSKFYLVSASVA